MAISLFEHFDTKDTAITSLYGAVWGAILFTASDNYGVVSVKLWMNRTGSPGTVTVSIRATAAGVPTGSDLCTATIDGNSFTTGATGAEYELTFTTNYVLTSGTVYALVFRAPSGDLSNKFMPFGNGAGGTNAYRSLNSGSTWSAISYDEYFQNYGITASLNYLTKYGRGRSRTNLGSSISLG